MKYSSRGKKCELTRRIAARVYRLEGNFRAPDDVLTVSHGLATPGAARTTIVSVFLRGRALLSPALSAVALALAMRHRRGSRRRRSYVPGEVLVGYRPARRPSVSVTSAAHGDDGGRAGTRPRRPAAQAAAAGRASAGRWRLRRQPGVAFAVPNFIAHADGAGYIPDDPGRGHVRGGWERMQWNFLPEAGVNAPEAWANLIAEHHPGGRGVTVAILDTGVAYRNWHHFRRSPDFNRTRFVHPYDFVAHNSYPLDREGHGTFVAGTVAECDQQRHRADRTRVRRLDHARPRPRRHGTGDAATISHGIRYAVKHGAQVINLSLEFSPDVTAGDIPDIIDAIKFATRHGVVVAAAAATRASSQIAYPAREPSAISVGATTRDRCLADYSNGGSALSTSSPPAAAATRQLGSDPDCHPGRRLPPIYQMTFFDGSNPDASAFPGGIFGTSMSAPDVSATAAMIIAGGVIGRHPTPDQSASGSRRPRGRSARQPPEFELRLGAARRRRRHRALARPHDQHRARRVVRDLVRHRAEQEALGAGHPLLPTTIRSERCSSATSRIASAASPGGRTSRPRHAGEAASCSAASSSASTSSRGFTIHWRSLGTSTLTPEPLAGHGS